MEMGWRSPVLFPLRDERRRVERRVRDLLFLGQPPLPPQEVSPLFFPPSQCLLFLLFPSIPTRHSKQWRQVKASLLSLFFSSLMTICGIAPFKEPPHSKKREGNLKEAENTLPPKKEGEEGGREGKLSAVKRSLGEI